MPNPFQTTRVIQNPPAAPDHIVCSNTQDLHINGVYVPPAASLKVRNHSPDGYAWGYGGSGPSQLGLAILLHTTKDVALAEKHYRAFVSEFIAPSEQDDVFRLNVSVLEWVKSKN